MRLPLFGSPGNVTLCCSTYRERKKSKLIMDCSVQQQQLNTESSLVVMIIYMYTYLYHSKLEAVIF